MTAVDAYLTRMHRLARDMGRQLAPVTSRDRAVRLSEVDAALVERGFETGLLTIERHNRVRTADPYQGTAWLIEGVPARPCWEYVPHMAAYVEMIEHLGHPAQAVRFETPESELGMDLAAMSEDGRVLILGQVKRESDQVADVERLVQAFDDDPGKPPTDATAGAPQGLRRETWRLAHQLWQTRAPYLWLVSSGTRKTYEVTYDHGLVLRSRPFLPLARELWPEGFDGSTPRLAVTVAS